MNSFKKIVELGPVGLEDWAEDTLKNYAEEIVQHDHRPETDEEIIEMIGDADAVLLRNLPILTADILSQAKNLKYVGMCCSLYSKESANVDIDYAEKNGITVTGIRDYGDNGVTEYVLYQLIRILHGFDFPMWKERPLEIQGLKIGFVGFGVSGQMTADALQFLGAEVSYYARSVKEEKEQQGMHFKDLHDLLRESDVVITCLNKNVILLHEEEFEALGSGKIMFNTSIGPASDDTALKNWLQNKKNLFCCDTRGALGAIAEEVLNQDNVICVDRSTGMTEQAYNRLSKKVLANIEEYFTK